MTTFPPMGKGLVVHGYTKNSYSVYPYGYASGGVPLIEITQLQKDTGGTKTLVYFGMKTNTFYADSNSPVDTQNIDNFCNAQGGIKTLRSIKFREYNPNPVFEN